MPSLQPTLLLTRPKDASAWFLDQLDPDLVAKVHVSVSPLLKIELRAAELDLSQVRGVIFTSRQAVQAASGLTRQRDIPAYCIGQATTLVAQQADWQATQVGHDAESLVEGLIGHRPASPLLHLRGRHTRGDVAQRLTAAGLPTGEQVLYDQVAQELTDEARTLLLDDGPVVAPLFSPRTAHILADKAPDRPLICAAMSDAVAAQLAARADWRVSVARSPDARSMAHLVEKLLQSSVPG